MTKAGFTPEKKPKSPPPPREKGTRGRKKRKKGKKPFSAAAIVSLIVFVLAVCVGGATLYVYSEVERQAGTFAIGQMLSGHPMGGMTAEEGTALLARLTDEPVGTWRFDITCQGRHYAITAEDVGLFVDRQATLDPLWQAGKTGSLLERFAQLVSARRDGMNGEPVLAYSMEPVDALLGQIVQETDCEPVDATVSYTPGSSEPFRFTDERTGYRLDTTALRAAIERALLALTPGSTELVPEELLPAVTRETLEGAITLRARVVMALADDEASLTNVRLAAGFLNGQRVEAGKTISFNTAVGRRTAESGFVAAPEPAYGEGISGVGGGVCQASTALYRAALLGGLAVEARSAAISPVDYCEMGQEAAVSDQGLDLVIRNTTQTPLFVTARVYLSGETPILELQLIGAPMGVRYALESQVLETEVIEQPVYVRDSEGIYATYTDERIAVGEAVPGYSVLVERVTLDEDGQELARETLSQEEYDPIAPMIYVGVQERDPA